MLPELPLLPEMQSVAIPDSRDISRLAALPRMVRTAFTNARALEAEELANDMRAAFAYSKAANKRSRAVAKAKGRRAQRIAERR